jgi:hypothetical protein
MKQLVVLAVLSGLAACAPPLPPPMAPSPPVALVRNLPPEVRHDAAPQWYDPSGNLIWPPNDGFARAPVAVALPTGMLLDRFGSPGGRFFSPQAAPYGARALPYDCEAQPYTVYRVDRPLTVASGTAAPWFGTPGGAIQYETRDTAAQMVAGRTLETLRDPGPPPCDGQ